MIESPLIQELLAEQGHEHIMIVLAARFGPVPGDIETTIRAIQDPAKLGELFDWVGRCPDLEAFRGRLSCR